MKNVSDRKKSLFQSKTVRKKIASKTTSLKAVTSHNRRVVLGLKASRSTRVRFRTEVDFESTDRARMSLTRSGVTAPRILIKAPTASNSGYAPKVVFSDG